MPPYLNSILTWGGALTNCNQLIMLQKRAVRIISHVGYYDHTAPLFTKLKVLQFSELYNYHLGIFMYKCMNNALPLCFQSYFTLTSNVHLHCTRSTTQKKLFVHSNRTSMFKNSLVQRGIIFWNSLNETLKNSPTLLTFAKKLKNQLLNLYSL